MKVCPVCGNEIEASATLCPYCDSSQVLDPIIRKQAVKRISVLKIKENNPTVDEALKLLTNEISAAIERNIKVIKIIHGYGSSGVGGAIKTSLLTRLNTLKNNNQVKSIITGEQHNEYAGSRNYLLNKYPELKSTWIEDRGNPGITFIELA